MTHLPRRPAGTGSGAGSGAGGWGWGAHPADTEQDLAHPVLSLPFVRGKTSQGVSSIREVRKYRNREQSEETKE